MTYGSYPYSHSNPCTTSRRASNFTPSQACGYLCTGGPGYEGLSSFLLLEVPPMSKLLSLAALGVAFVVALVQFRVRAGDLTVR